MFDSTLFERTNVLSCIGCGHTTPLLEERQFRCPKCRNLYEVVHPETPEISKQTIRDRFVPGTPAFQNAKGSDVWAFQEMILPNAPTESLISLGESVSIVPVEGKLKEWIGGNIDLWMALEGITPTGSFKDIGMPVAVTIAKLAGAEFIICASTGDTSAAAAASAAAAGIPCFVVLPQGLITPSQGVQPHAHGAKIMFVPGDFDACMRIVQELVEKHGAYPVNSINPGRIEGHQTTVFKSWLQFGKLPDWFVLPLGNGSNTSSIGKGYQTLARHFPEVRGELPQVLSAQPANAAPLARSYMSAGGLEAQIHGEAVNLAEWQKVYRPLTAGKTFALATKIGAPVSYEKVMRVIAEHKGVVQPVSDRHAREAMFAAGASGHMVCPQTGLALAALRSSVSLGSVKDGQKVVVVSTAHGLKFASDFEPQDGEGFGTTLKDTSTSSALEVLGL